MAIIATPVAVTSTPAKIADGGEFNDYSTVFVLPDATNDVFIGPVGVTTVTGFKIKAGTTIPLGPFQLGPGDSLYAVTATTATLGVLATRQ